MKQLQKTFLVCCAAMCLSLVAVASQAANNESMIDKVVKNGVMRVGFSSFVPWAMQDKNGEYIGFEVDVAKRLAKDLGVDIELVPTRFSGIVPALLANKFDIIIGSLSVTPERRHGETVFCHGDFHYANVLWKDQHISAILDFELAGYGNRDFDIAWALFLRPGQRFLKTDKEQALFIKGYQKHGDCNVDAVIYYMAQCFVYFLCFCDEKDYCEYVRNWLKQNCSNREKLND